MTAFRSSCARCGMGFACFASPAITMSSCAITTAHIFGIEVVESTIHEGQNGRRYLVVHGDAFDVVVRYARWLALLGDGAYELALRVNARVNWVRRNLGLTYWSLSQWAKL